MSAHVARLLALGILLAACSSAAGHCRPGDDYSDQGGGKSRCSAPAPAPSPGSVVSLGAGGATIDGVAPLPGK